MTTIAAAANQPNKPNLIPHPVASEYRYSIGAFRYIDSQGRFVSATTVRAAVDKVIDGANGSIQQTAQRLQAGQISLDVWQRSMMQQVKIIHVANGLAALGGQKQASQSDLGHLGSLIKKQYQYLNDFAKDIASGKQKLDGSFLNRVKLYAEAGRGTYESARVREAKLLGFTLGRRVLGAGDTCSGCLEQAAKGWQPLGEIAPIGSQQCKTNCKCTIIIKGD